MLAPTDPSWIYDLASKHLMDTTQKIEEGLEQVSNEKFYKPLKNL